SSTSLTTTRNWSVGLDGGTNDLKFSLDDTLGNTTLFALMNDGEAELYTTGGTRTYLLDADDGGSGAEMYLYDSTGSERIQLDAQYETGSGGWIGLRNASGTRTITLNADYNGTGDGRIISSVVEITGGSDLAEPFETISNEIIEAGTLMVIDAEHPGMLKISDEAYDKKVAGIVSGAGGVNPGLLLHQDGVMSGNTPIAIAGRVYCKVDASYGSIEPGDLLTTSTTPGYAMKADSQEKSHGTIIGKAMSVLKDGRGLVLVLVNLQ
ncbi:MAG: hypothetical protein HYZ34_05710, partial [Ignavibacteriae bacterium]|nr:hypothetical protein [Ignavibacteriota bacterium]